MSRIPLRRWALLGIAVLLVAIAAPSATAFAGSSDCPDCPVTFETPTFLDPGSPQTREIRALFVLILILAAGVFVVVEALLLISVWRFRNRPPEMAVQTHGNTRLEIAWTAAPAVVLATLLGFTLRTMATVRSPVGDGEPLAVKVIGHQWWWEFRYPDLGIVTANELVVPRGRGVQLEIESVDVIHSFWIPELHGKQDAIPGQMHSLAFVAESSGVFGGQCAEYCGDQHANMRMAVVALEPTDFDAWVLAQQAPAAEELSEAAAAGRDFFLSGACAACHAVAGTTAEGRVGPDLTHLASRDFIAGGVLANTPENLKRWVFNPQEWKPGTLMPALGLDETSLDNVVAYLTSLK